MPPSWRTSTSACCERIWVTGTAAVMTVRWPTGLISRARKAIVVPEAMMIESSCEISSAAAAPMARFSATFFFSFFVDVTVADIGTYEDGAAMGAVELLLLFEVGQVLADGHFRNLEKLGELCH